jgi:hypothetical protein
MWRFCIKKKFNHQLQYSLIHLQKTSSTTEIERPIPKKTDDASKHKIIGLYARSIACNWISGGEKLILSSIIGHHGLVAKKNQARFEKLRDFKPKKIIDSTTYKSTGKNYNTRRFKRRHTIKVSKWLLAPKPKKQMCLTWNLQSIRGYGQKVLEPLPFVMLGIF